jgi:hypothetical protein
MSLFLLENSFEVRILYKILPNLEQRLIKTINIAEVLVIFHTYFIFYSIHINRVQMKSINKIKFYMSGRKNKQLDNPQLLVIHEA